MSAGPIGVAVLRVALRRAWALILIPAAVAGLAFAGASLSAPQWKSHAMLTLHTAVGTSPTMPGIQSTKAEWAVITQINTQIKLFHSRAVLTRAGQRELHEELVALAAEAPAEGERPGLPMPNGTTGVNPLEAIVADHDPSGATRTALEAITWQGPTSLDDDAAADPLAAAFVEWALSKKGPFGESALRGALTVQRVNGSDLVNATFLAEQQTLAPRLLAATLEECNAVLAVSQQNDSSTHVAFFEQRVREAAGKLEEREQALKTFMSANDIANFIDQTRALAQQIEGTRGNLAKVEEDTARYARRRTAIADALGGEDFLKNWATRGALDADLLQLRTRVADERAQRWLKGTTGSADDLVEAPPPDTLEARVEAFLDGRVTGLEPHRKTLVYDWLVEDLEHGSSVAARTILEKYLTESEEHMRRYAALGSEIKRREREIGVAEAEYLELVKGLNAARLLARQADNVSPFAVTDQPTVPREQEPRGRVLTALMGAFIALSLVVLVILVLEQIDQSLTLPSAFETAYDLPVLGGLPLLTSPDAPADDASPVVKNLMASLAKRVANVADGAARIQVVAMQPGTGTSVVARVLAAHGHTVDDRGALAVCSDALAPAPDTLTVWVATSGATVGAAELRALRDLEDAGAPVVGIAVNHLTYQGAEELLGSVPKSRTWVRAWLKRLASLQFGKEGAWRPKA